jgi:nucleoside-diphosphate kinase
MKEPVLVVVKPDGTVKGIIGEIISRFLHVGLELVGAKVINVPREKAKEHYGHLRDKPFYNQIVDYLTGKFHGSNKAMALVFVG